MCLSLIVFILKFSFITMYVCSCAYATVYVWRSEDNSWDLLSHLSIFCILGSRDTKRELAHVQLWEDTGSSEELTTASLAGI